jgi:hypothetical protein
MASTPGGRSRKAQDDEGPQQIGLFQVAEVPTPFRKAVQVLHSKPNTQLSLVQRKLMNCLIKNATETTPDGDNWWYISTQRVADEVHFNSNNHKHLQDAARQLMPVVFEWDLMAATDKRVRWKASVLFPEVEIMDGMLRYQISSQMMEAISNPAVYALLDMNKIAKFRRSSTVAIYEFVTRYSKLGATKEVPWRVLRDMVLGGDSENSTSYQEYKRFKNKILNPALIEMRDTAGLEVEINETKLRNEVQSLYFRIVNQAPATESEQPAETIKDETVLLLVGQLVEIGLVQSEARKLVNDHPHEDLTAAIQYVRKRLNDGKAKRIENPSAYFRRCLSARWFASEVTELPAKPSPTTRPTPPRMARENADSNLKLLQQYNLQQSKEALAYFRELGPDEQQVKLDQYNQQQATAQLRVIPGKKLTKAAEVAFASWLAIDTWGQPSTDDLLRFAVSLIEGRAS